MFVGDWETILMWASELREMFRQYTVSLMRYFVSRNIGTTEDLQNLHWEADGERFLA